MHILPLTEENISKNILKFKVDLNNDNSINNTNIGHNGGVGGRVNDNENRDGNILLDNENEELDDFYKFKLLIKLSFFLIVFSSYFKGFYFYFLILVLALYYW